MNDMQSRSVTTLLTTLAILAAVLAGTVMAQSVQPSIEQLSTLRQMLAGYENVDAAIADGFEQFGTCMTSDQGSQGIHFTNAARIGDPAIDALVPEVLMYEPREDGTLRLVGAELLVFTDDWHATGVAAVPAALGREFGINTTLLDRPFYMLHVWVLQHNPIGFFANWNPLVTCDHEGTVAHVH